MEEMFKQIITKLNTLDHGQLELKSEIGGMKSELAGIKSDVGSLKSEVSDLKSDVGSLKSEFNNFKLEVRTGFEAVHKKLDMLSAQVAHNTEQEVRLNNVVARVDQLETDVKVIKMAISNQ